MIHAAIATVAWLLLLTVTARPDIAEGAGAGWQEGEAVRGEVLVRLRSHGMPRAETQKLLETLLPGAIQKQVLTEDGWHLIGLPPGISVGEAVALLSEHEAVEFSEPNLLHRMMRPLSGGTSGGSSLAGPRAAASGEVNPDDPMFPRQYALERIGAPAAWKHTRGTNAVVIAVIDTGVDYTHPDLAPNMWRNPGEIPGNGRDDDNNGFVDDVHGINLLSGNGDVTDPEMHGTHIAGIIGAVGNNGVGVAGINWNAQILAVRLARDADGLMTGDKVRGIEYLIQMKRRGVNIVACNLSWGGNTPSLAVSSALRRLAEAGVVIVCAGGNFREDRALIPKYPSDYNHPGFIRVAASNADDHLAQFTDFGAHTIDLAAPGEYIWSTVPGNRYAALTGSSMAAPQVTGAVGLLFSIRPDLTPEQVKWLLMQTADPLPAFDQHRVVSGGRLNVGRAVEWLVEGRPIESFSPRPPPGHSISLISRNANGYDSNEASTSPALSENGRFVAFVSRASDLVADDTNRLPDVFLHDREAGWTVLVSRGIAGESAQGASSSPAVSADGTVVVFASTASDLVPEEAPPGKKIFAWNRASGGIEWISRPEVAGAGGTGDEPSVSGDGNLVVFQSTEPLKAGDNNSVSDVYLRNRSTGELVLVSVTPAGESGSGPSTTPAIAANGRHAAFVSGASDLVDGDANSVADIFVRDLDAAMTERISVATGGAEADGPSSRPKISGEGRFVAFQSTARNLDSGATRGTMQVFLRDRNTGTTTLASRAPDGSALTGSVSLEAISADGRWVLFRSDSDELPPGYGARLMRLFAFDRLAGDVVALSYNDAGEPVRGILDGAISGDGRFVAMSTAAWNVVPLDGNVMADVFALDRGPAPLDLVLGAGDGSMETGRGLCHPRVPQHLNLPAGSGSTFVLRVINRGADQESARLRVSPAEAALDWNGPDGLAGGQGGVFHLPKLEAGGEFVTRFTVAGVPAGKPLIEFEVSGESGEEPARGDRVSLHLPRAGFAPPGFEWVSMSNDGSPLRRHAERPTVSDDGARVVFSSGAGDVVSGDTNEGFDVFLLDRTAGTIAGISRPRNGPLAGASFGGAISGNGKFAVFTSFAGALGANGTGQVFVKDLETGQVDLASRSPHGQPGNYRSAAYGDAEISADGRWVAFSSFATTLAPGDTNRFCDVFLYDRVGRAMTMVSRGPDGAVGNGVSGRSFQTILSRSGRFVAFPTMANNLGPPDSNGYFDTCLFDRETGGIELLSSTGAGAAAAGQSLPVGITEDGRYAVLYSDATDLPGGLTDAAPHFYLLDRVTRQVQPAESWLPFSGEAPWSVAFFNITANGEWLILGLRRETGLNSARTLESRVELVHRASGRRIHIASGSRGPHGVQGEFSEVLAATPYLVNSASPDGRFITFIGEGREGSPFVSQAYLFDRAEAALTALAGRSAETVRPMDTQASQPVSRETYLLVTPGRPAPIHLVLRNAGEFSDTLELAPAMLGPGWELDVQTVSGPAPADDGSAAVFPKVAPGGEVVLIATLTWSGNGEPAPVELAARSHLNRNVEKRIRLIPLLDSDGDGIADAWEMAHFGNLNTAGAETDFNEDGVSDRFEFLAGSNPKLADEPLRVTELERLGDGRIRLAWPTVQDRIYGIDRAAAAGERFVPVSNPVMGTTHGIEIILDPEDSPSGIYRVWVDLP